MQSAQAFGNQPPWLDLKISLKTLLALFIRERLITVAFLACDNYDFQRRRQIQRQINR
jgi:hypothetical protein